MRVDGRGGERGWGGGLDNSVGGRRKLREKEAGKGGRGGGGGGG